ncbi:hypothetical protein EKD04_016580 [Chloroflexales bacterium ZM16-3]|nr:hypothetical protein [Chloroflexales bacterium ZM16-3]
MNQPTPAEQRAFTEMQARLVALLLRFNEADFARRYGQRDGSPPGEAIRELQPYRDLAALALLRDELFDDIMPRIVRRLSFEAPRQTLREEPPPRGRVDWERTLDATWASTPGEPPLQLHTRQRRRDFTTPENVYVVAALLEYRADILRVLWDERLIAQADALRHPLNAMVDQCERELAFPQFAGIRTIADQALDAGEIDLLIEQIQERSIPGGNSAYDDLIAWRQRRLMLPLLQRDLQTPVIALGADPQRDNYLYQLWIFYELAALLREREAMEPDDLTLQPMRLRFRWKGCTYELQHDQEVRPQVAMWSAQPDTTSRVPRVRPDFYLWRCDPQRQEVHAGDTLIWREPGVIWDAKYYRERESPNAPASPIKRMIADLTLIGEPYGVLLFAFLTGSQSSDTRYTISPDATRNQPLAPGQSVVVQPLTPALPGEQSDVSLSLAKLLDEAHARLHEPRQPRCQGVFLDTLSLCEHGALLGRDGAHLPDNDVLACPKLHIGPWRVDLVSRTAHCCRDGRLCHIINQPGAAPPVRPPRNARELLRELERLFESGDLGALDENEAAVEAVISRIEALTRRFAEITGALNDLGRYEAKLGDIGLDRTLHLLGPTERESLALAIYLRDQLDEVGANDYSASIIHVARVLECELQRRMLAIPGVSGSDFPHGKPTLGTLGGVRRRNPALWGRIDAHLIQVWAGNVDPEDATFAVTVGQLIDEVEQLVRVRNQAAHTTPIPRDRFRTLLRSLCDGGPLRVGALNVLLTAWPAA